MIGARRIVVRVVMKIDVAEAKRRLTSLRNIVNLAERPATSVFIPGHEELSSNDQQVEPIQPAQSNATQSATRASVTHETIDRGYRRDSPTVPEFLRDMMGNLVTSGSKASDVARAFEVSGDVAERAASGRVGGRPATAERRAKVQARRLDIQDQALQKLMLSLNLIQEDDLAECGPKELSGIAVNLGRVAQLQQEITENANTTNIVVYAPQLREEKKFKMVDV